MPTFIRLTDFKSSKEKEKEFFNKKNEFVVNEQNDFLKIPGSPIAYWVSDSIKNVFEANINLDEIIDVTGSQNITANNNKYLRFLWEVNEKSDRWVSYSKGGEFRKWYGNLEYVVDWSQDAKSFYETNNTSNLLNSKYWFKEGIGYTDITNSKVSMRLYRNHIYDKSGPIFHLKERTDLFYVLGLMNSVFINEISRLLNHTIHLQVKDVKNFPLVIPSTIEIRQRIDLLTQRCIDISCEEWDSHETSWDFTTNELLRHKTTNQIEDAYNTYCTYWKGQFFKLHANEVELNRIFIDIYDLADELTPDVPLEEITILKDESEIKDGELVFKKETLVKQFISYAVGCMFGRYSPDKPGLILANQGETIDDFREKVLDESFMPDDDNIIPVLEDEYFKDDIVGRFKEFLKTTFGAEALSENLEFIAGALSKSKSKKSNTSPEKVIRNYFLKDFFKDHVKMYKKRPIYWLFTSGKGRGFNALVYMHRYNRETLAKMRTDYLLELEAKLDARIGMLGDEAGVEKTRLGKQVKELMDYDAVLNHMSLQMIDIDLDDGVKVNYAKFERLVGNI